MTLCTWFITLTPSFLYYKNVFSDVQNADRFHLCFFNRYFLPEKLPVHVFPEAAAADPCFILCCFYPLGNHASAINTKTILPYTLLFFNHKFCKYKKIQYLCGFPIIYKLTLRRFVFIFLQEPAICGAPYLTDTALCPSLKNNLSKPASLQKRGRLRAGRIFP